VLLLLGWTGDKYPWIWEAMTRIVASVFAAPLVAIADTWTWLVLHPLGFALIVIIFLLIMINVRLGGLRDGLLGVNGRLDIIGQPLLERLRIIRAAEEEAEREIRTAIFRAQAEAQRKWRSPNRANQTLCATGRNGLRRREGIVSSIPMDADPKHGGYRMAPLGI